MVVEDAAGGGSRAVAAWPPGRRADPDAAGATSLPLGDRGALVVEGEVSQEVRGDLAALAAVAAENADLRAALAARDEERTAARRVAAAIASEIEPAALFDLVAEQAAALLRADGGRVMRVDGEETGAVLGAWRAPGLTPAARGRVALDGSDSTSLVRRTGRPARADPAGGDLRARVAAPIVVDGTVWGAVSVASRDPAALPPGSEERLTGLAELVAVAVANVDARDRVVIDATASIFATHLDMESTLRAIADSAKRGLRADRATCYVHTEDESAVAAVYTTESEPRLRRFLEASVGLGPDRMPIWGHLLGSAEPLLVSEDVVDDPAIPPRVARALGARAFLVARLEHASLVEGGAPARLGTLFVSYAEPRAISGRDRLACRSLAGLAALAIANVRLHARTVEALERAERLAATDDLTGLANQRAFRERLETEVARAARNRRPLALALIDLDHFKRVNDEHGHHVGDQTLTLVAATLAREARRGELVARVGGEEFAWIVPEADSAHAAIAVERARSALEATDFPAVGRLTASAGVADLAVAGDDPDLLYRLADTALYRAKRAGRNLVADYAGGDV